MNNKLEFIGQNMHDMFDDHFSRIEIHLSMKSVGNDASTSNTDKTMGGSASDKIPTTLLSLVRLISIAKLIIIHHLVQMCHMGLQVCCDILHRRTLLNLVVHRSQIGLTPMMLDQVVSKRR